MTSEELPCQPEGDEELRQGSSTYFGVAGIRGMIKEGGQKGKRLPKRSSHNVRRTPYLEFGHLVVVTIF